MRCFWLLDSDRGLPVSFTFGLFGVWVLFTAVVSACCEALKRNIDTHPGILCRRLCYHVQLDDQQQPHQTHTSYPTFLTLLQTLTTPTRPQNYMFAEMRAVLGISKGTDILDHIYSLPSAGQDAAHEQIRAIERRAMAQQKPQPGLVELMSYLDSHGVRKAICTRNFEYVLRCSPAVYWASLCLWPFARPHVSSAAFG